jgi:site-specific DNA-methyltransferase (adenine-specific)
MPAHAAAPRTVRVELDDWIHAGRHLPPGSVDLVYADPPFNTGLMRRDRAGAFADSFDSTLAYLDWLGPRLRGLIPLLKPTGSIILHLDWRTSHRVRVLLDEVLGEDRFVNHLIWHYGLGGSSPRRFARKHDDLLWYCLDPDLYYFDPPRVRATSNRLAGRTKKATDVLNIPSINNMAKERTGYPTQKPLALLGLLVAAGCPEGGLVLDPCCGSGTTLAAAHGLGRDALGLDLNPEAVALTRRRLGSPWAGAPSEPAASHSLILAPSQ